MTTQKADELWEKYSSGMGIRMTEPNFIAALHEYGQAVRKRDAEICNKTMHKDDVDWYGPAECAAAISREPLP